MTFPTYIYSDVQRDGGLFFNYIIYHLRTRILWYPRSRLGRALRTQETRRPQDVYDSNNVRPRDC
jgi:hypothetical protein